MKNLLTKILTYHRLPALILTVCLFFCVPLFIGNDKIIPTELSFKASTFTKPTFHPRDNKLADVNDVQIIFAEKVGIKPFRNEEELNSSVDSLIALGKLAYITSCREFEVDDLTHSHPYLTRAARQLLIDIGERFQQKQIERGLKVHKMLVTSVLRSEQGQRKLRRRNGNATQSTTCHLYATTFDISAKRFIHYDFLGNKSETSGSIYLKLLEESVKELRAEGRCVAMREYHQACIHITSTN